MTPEQESKEGLISGRGERILVMDDEDAVREVACEMLTNFGYEVGSARDGMEAIEAYIKAKERGYPFDVVITDLTVPGGMGGKELVRRLLETDPDVKAIVCSGYSSGSILSDLRERGFTDVVTKPYRAEELSSSCTGYYTLLLDDCAKTGRPGNYTPTRILVNFIGNKL